MKENALKITILGSGTSQGIPVITCECDVCQSVDTRDQRLRSSILLEYNELKLVVDTGPDFRQQMLRAKVPYIDAVLYTHMHKDHLSGLDDIRAFNFKQNSDMPVYCDVLVEEALHREFEYVFKSTYPGIPKLSINLIDKDYNENWKGLQISALEVMHYKLPVLAFRFNNFGYVTDAKTVEKSEIEKLKGVEVLVVNALRKEEHISHFNLEEALAFIAQINPKKAYLTHISHLMGKQQEEEIHLPPNVYFAYDGLEIYLED